jgi:hypothetical protein
LGPTGFAATKIVNRGKKQGKGFSFLTATAGSFSGRSRSRLANFGTSAFKAHPGKLPFRFGYFLQYHQ